MKKNNLSSIRNNINRRKQEKKKINYQKSSTDFSKRMTIEDEERHGFYPSIPSYSGQSNNNHPLIFRAFLLRSIIAVFLFVICAVSINSESSLLEKPKEWTSYVLKEEFPFATVNAWYQAKFGAPFAWETSVTEGEEIAVLPAFGQVNQSFQENGQGILITAEEETEVAAVEAGTVLFAGNDPKTGKTVIIQHADRSKTIYGYLTDIEVHSYQSVRSNQVIGSYEPSEANKAIYFAVEKNQQYIDPIQVIHVNEQQ
ncbi:stage IV sporulation protein FA [Gracilibacillus ureilyticus]|uniref:Stage IV sporulation protein FA n=1 Tax=Gracilibacillus ureilyticus TaxID=531814 RepID=A0A1H9RPB8_9BACI|nr:M23 family metallopeptidase [Gracilibacillus ureilyticus]SER74612.1 stage IV sporulation protein FA [Gracilibacillus ureilyticus]